MADLKPPFTPETAHQKVKFAQNMWNTCDPEKVVKGYTKDCIWRNRDQFLKGSEQIKSFLTNKWSKEQNYRLRKELFAFGGPQSERIAVQFWYEYQDAHDGMKWKRCYGLEDWTFETQGEEAGKMRKRMMSGNDVLLGVEGDGLGNGLGTGEEGWVEGRWFVGEEEGGICSVEGVDENRVTSLLTDRHF